MSKSIKSQNPPGSKPPDSDARAQVDDLNLQAQALLGVNDENALKLIDEARDLAIRTDYQLGLFRKVRLH